MTHIKVKTTPLVCKDGNADGGKVVIGQKPKIEYRHGSVCDGCGIYIEWIKMESGKMMPVNPEGATFITAEGKVVKGFISHFATCPKADKFRKGKV